MAPSRYDERHGYSSDEDSIRSRRRRARHRSFSPTHARSARPRNSKSYPVETEDDDKTIKTLGKVVLGVVIVQVVATAFSHWMRKEEDREAQRKREKRRQFERAKAKRRREEDRFEREREETFMRRGRGDEEGPRVMLIENGPEEEEERRSDASIPRMIEAAPGWYDEEGARRERQLRRGRHDGQGADTF